MNNLDLSITTATVEIKVVKVGRSKMTLSVFKQIIEEPLFDAEFKLKGEVLGYVNKSGQYVLWVYNGMLRKTRLIEIELPKIETEKDRLGNIVSYVYDFSINSLYKKLKIISDKDYSKVFKPKRTRVVDFEEYLNVEGFKVYKNFYDDILNNNSQLYIAI